MNSNKKLIIFFLMLSVFVMGVTAVCMHCNRRDSYQKIEYVIGISQANMREAWRLALISEIQTEAENYDNVRLIVTDAASDINKQENDVKRLQDLGIDLLIISPYDAEEMTPVISSVYQKIPVIVMDRAVEGFDYTLFIGPDNRLIGRQAGECAAKMLSGEKGTVLELCGSRDSLTSMERSKGFHSVMEEFPNIQVQSLEVPGASKDQAEDLLMERQELLKNTDVIFAHNDYMAFGAQAVVERLGGSIQILGIDGFEGKNKGLDLVSRGKIRGTITCPTGGKQAIQYAMDILNQVSGVPKQVILRSHVVTGENIENWLAGKDRTAVPPKKTITVGFSQVGTESSFRIANSRSIQDAAGEFGFQLIMRNANQKQENQIAAIREFIQMKVDVIAISPVVEDGWDEVLSEARDAGIPVFLSDRTIKTDQEDLVTTYIGADFLEEGRRAMRWILDNDSTKKESIHIMEIRGTPNASPTVQRKEGFEEIMAENPRYRIVDSRTGHFTYEGGREAVELYLEEHGKWDLDTIFAHNDDMALGAIEALEKNGVEPGKQVMIVSVDGTRSAFKAMIAGKLNCTVECNPLLGPQLMKAIQDQMDGKEQPLRIITEEKVYDQSMAKELIRKRKY